MIPQIGFPDTIFALSSGRLPSGVAVVRLSGAQVRFVVETISTTLPEPRRAAYRQFRSQEGELLDQGLLLFFPGPHSFTGEDCAEFHLHGGIAVIDRFLRELSSFEHCRMAEPGEFTRRAFANGKMDLTIAEGLADLVSAETEGQRRLALQVASGAQRDLYMDWRRELIQGRALIEAELDFADESDVPGSVSTKVWEAMKLLSDQISRHLADGRRAAVFRDGLHVAIIGAPNAGKSSLLNMLAGRDVAIISEEAGTTRDLIEVKLDLGGIPVFLADTAGLREAEGIVERMGIERARARANSADLVLLLEDMRSPESVPLPDFDGEMWRVGNKKDLAEPHDQDGWRYLISARTGQGMDELVAAITRFAEDKAGRIGNVVPTRRRHMDLLEATVGEINEALTQEDLPLELRAENLRRASQFLGRITGDVNVEDILDVIFSQFCIGK
ncbi:tRNA uridine-5-carboxymethylaminomethyl(34) synthesis GTPase MnmE [Phyllobacterium salinisoli]|uniref:tRNA modification GTPase MnmE n=1 Tax=Phyllobacterium salinisoli TaxID=1899321 RepID=A0A368K011_9HYPH|nr:tRNA uridine-5-carboxymethylaminomethyl(34) synthesis GTPase MnmE [Phyllobacterium salinisoli]RCS22504.1 tRNA uridine-5-carboxymethylaminomethyl(34) synthesis GTPase MnmE [Phyllobacterium salinisoli]